MCWPTHVDSYRPPGPRYRSTRRYTTRYYSPSPPPVRRISRTIIRQPEPAPLPPPPAGILPPPPPSIPPPPMSTNPPTRVPSKAPSAAPAPDPPPASKAPTSKTPSKAPSAAPAPDPPSASVAPTSKTPSKAPTAAPDLPPASKVPSKAASQAPSKVPSKVSSVSPSKALSRKSEFVEVSEDAASSSGSSGAGSRHTPKTKGSRRTSAPPSVYSMHEREREIRRYTRPNHDAWETYRYVEAPIPPPGSRARSASSTRNSGQPGWDHELKVSIKR